MQVEFWAVKNKHLRGQMRSEVSRGIKIGSGQVLLLAESVNTKLLGVTGRFNFFSKYLMVTPHTPYDSRQPTDPYAKTHKHWQDQ